jgi:hypothetical protein
MAIYGDQPPPPPRKDDIHVFWYFLNSNQYSVWVIIYSSFLVHRVIRPSSAPPHPKQFHIPKNIKYESQSSIESRINHFVIFVFKNIYIDKDLYYCIW